MFESKCLFGNGCAFAVALGLAFALTACHSGSNDNSDQGGNSGPGGGNVALTIATDKGKVAGIQSEAMREFLGIPYAAPPEKDLRWKPPQPAQAWSEVRQADTFANHCPQNASPFGTPSTSEDCLYLNVFAPKDDKPHPVMVWLHGGAYIFGEGSGFNPAPLVEKGVVVVTINYRLGALGFLAHPALTADSADNSSGDYGLMDQQAALEWVQRNIANFGGDPKNVTLFGVSAGGLSVIAQMVSPTAKGLFEKAIVESGSYSLALPTGQPTLRDAEDEGETFANAVGCTDQSLSCLRNLPVQKILDNQGTAPTRFIPNTGTPVLPKSIIASLTSGDFNQVPVIEGTNHDEWRLFVALNHDLTPSGPLTKDTYLASIQATFLLLSPQQAQVIADQYPLDSYPNADLAMAAAGTDGAFSCTGLGEIGLLSQHVPTYAYEFADPKAPQVFLPPVPSFSYGATHMSEVPYLFDFFSGANLVKQPSLNADQKQLSQDMMTYWTQFARAGNPNPSNGVPPFWPQFSDGGGTYLSLVPSEPVTRPAADIAQEHQCAFWNSLLTQIQSEQ